ncbi:MAG: DUF305 domain-containing protein [Cytophagales bacterium]|nr:DUF305 domain-containing protein [Armatimonadota bacterium]
MSFKQSLKQSLVSSTASSALLALLIVVGAAGALSVPPPTTDSLRFQGDRDNRDDRDNRMEALDEAMLSAPLNGNPDHDFAVMMIPHHREAVGMAGAELLYGKNPVLRRLAQEIIVSQQQEILMMQQQLAGPSRAVPGKVPRRITAAVSAPAAVSARSAAAPPAAVSAPAPVSPRDRVYSGD